MERSTIESATRSKNSYTYDDASHSCGSVNLPFESLIYIESAIESPPTTTSIESFTRDPIGYKGSPHNLYEFVGGRAMSATDPTGETWAEWGCCPGINVYIGRRCSLRCNTGMPAVLTGQVNELARILANQLFDDPAKNAAMRHCIALGIISHESGCPCAKCIGDAREYYQETCQGQSPRYTVQGRYHNEAGYECAGCGGISPPKGKPFIAWPLGYSPPAEWGKIVNCCLEKVQSGRVDDPTNPNQPEPEVGPLHGGGISPWIYF